MEDYSKALHEQLKEIDSLLLVAEKNVKKTSLLPQGHMYVKASHGYPQYYFQDADSSERRYLHSSEHKLIKQLAQAEYDKRMLALLRKLRSSLRHFLSTYDILSVKNLYEKLCPGRKTLVTPILPSDDMFIEQWMEEHPGNKNPFPEAGSYLTERGETVRSKSEKILADLFHSMDIPYQYEPLLELQGYLTVYPDFVLLNVKNRKTYYWEHFGLTDDPEYAQKAFRKLEMYEANGLFVGKNLITSMESTDHPLNIKTVKEKISQYFN
ncbi:MAG: hypothetical protein K6F31_02335 [Acetatifactor sp.]|nr:hypothetical protein [Acetatifactor sp.]